jgi:hypothetical protein
VRFPRLLLRGVEVACKFLSEEKDFISFCRVIAPIFRDSTPPPPPPITPLTPPAALGYPAQSTVTIGAEIEALYSTPVSPHSEVYMYI